MLVRVLPLSLARHERWRNGCGATRVLYEAWPGLRVSLATLEASAPFSLFPRLWRRIRVVEGAFTLVFDDTGERVALDPLASPFAWDGARPCHADLERGPALALNVMTATKGAAPQLAVRGPATCVFVSLGPSRVLGRELAPFDVLHVSLADGELFSAEASGETLVCP